MLIIEVNWSKLKLFVSQHIPETRTKVVHKNVSQDFKMLSFKKANSIFKKKILSNIKVTLYCDL